MEPRPEEGDGRGEVGAVAAAAGSLFAPDVTVLLEKDVVRRVVALCAEIVSPGGENQPVLPAVIEVAGVALVAFEGGMQAARRVPLRLDGVAVAAAVRGEGASGR